MLFIILIHFNDDMYNSNDCFRHLFWIKILSVRISLSLNFENINTKTIFDCHGNGMGFGSESDGNGSHILDNSLYYFKI